MHFYCSNILAFLGGHILKKRILIISAAVAGILLLTACIIFLVYSRNNIKPDTTESSVGSTISEAVISSTEATAPPKPPFISQKDFASLKKQYPHIHGWIEIPGTVVDYPIIQHPDDETYYLRRDAEGNYNINGCIFSEHLYNKTDFSDPITVLYGHYVYEYDGFKFFGGLQTTYRDDLETYGEIVIYHPEKELHYEIFAAVPYNQYHVLHGRDYSKPETFKNFVDGIKAIEEYGANVNKDYPVEPDDRLLVLSTCYNGNTDRRFLVVAKLVEELN